MLNYWCGLPEFQFELLYVMADVTVTVVLIILFETKYSLVVVFYAYRVNCDVATFFGMVA